jgi:hypothetical protein
MPTNIPVNIARAKPKTGTEIPLAEELDLPVAVGLTDVVVKTPPITCCQ